jgi:CheY-like chemotaxis protein
MRVLFVDAFDSLSETVLQTFRIRGHELLVARSAGEALNLTAASEFDCIFLDIATAGDSVGLTEMRLLARRSAIVLMSTSPLAALAAEAVEEGSIEFRSVPVLISNIQDMPQPLLLVAPDFHPTLIKAIKEQGLRISIASTLQFAMNLMADGWCQIVCLNAEVPGLTQSEDVAVAHRVAAREIAILAAGLPIAGITLTEKPRKPQESIALLQQLAASRPFPCGSMENQTHHKES